MDNNEISASELNAIVLVGKVENDVDFSYPFLPHFYP